MGQNPFEIERIWQHMYMDTFYPPGREKIHGAGRDRYGAVGHQGQGLAVAGLRPAARHQPELRRVLRHDLPASERAGFSRRPAPPAMAGTALRERARAAMEAGYRVFRVDASIGGPIVGNVFSTHERVRLVAKACKEIRDGVGEGDWMIDFHQKFDFADALRCCRLIEDYEPFLVEDPVRDEQALEEIPKLRLMTTCPLAHGEEWGQRWDFHRLVYDKHIDYIRATLPNVGGLTEMAKVMALCETSAVGIVPHFTGPVATAALVHAMTSFSGPALMEYNYGDRPPQYLPEFVTFKGGKLYPNERPGLGVTVDFKALTQIAEFDQPRTEQCLPAARRFTDSLVASGEDRLLNGGAAGPARSRARRPAPVSRSGAPPCRLRRRCAPRPSSAPCDCA